jgi:alpha-L-fucosidase
MNRTINLAVALIAALFLMAATPLLSFAQTPGDKPYTPSASNLRARRWFQDAKFGLFIHWGIYSVPGGEWNGRKIPVTSEWIMHGAQLPISVYEGIAPQFNPVEFDPAEWVRLAKDAGMRYITITSKHHDGFAMWDSKVSDWDVVDRTPYKRDILKMLADECRKQNIKLFFYHSHLDWHHPDYFPRGMTGQHAGRAERGDFNRYLDYMDSQLAELLGGRYGEVAGIWFDGWWDQQDKSPGAPPTKTKLDWRLRQTYDLIHRLQPQTLVGNNHHVAPFAGEDFQMFEKDLPGANTAGFNKDAVISQLPLETAETTNESWGYDKTDKKFKSPEQLIALLVRAAGHDANLLLNIGPQPSGKFPPEAVNLLQDIGRWTARYGETIYGTRGGPVKPQPWGVTTQKADRVFVHVLDREATHGEEINLGGMGNLKIKRATLFGSKTPVRFDATKKNLYLPKSSRDSVDTIVMLEVAK